MNSCIDNGQHKNLRLRPGILLMLRLLLMKLLPIVFGMVNGGNYGNELLGNWGLDLNIALEWSEEENGSDQINIPETTVN